MHERERIVIMALWCALLLGSILHVAMGCSRDEDTASSKGPKETEHECHTDERLSIEENSGERRFMIRRVPDSWIEWERIASLRGLPPTRDSIEQDVSVVLLMGSVDNRGHIIPLPPIIIHRERVSNYWASLELKSLIHLRWPSDEALVHVMRGRLPSVALLSELDLNIVWKGVACSSSGHVLSGVILTGDMFATAPEREAILAPTGVRLIDWNPRYWALLQMTTIDLGMIRPSLDPEQYLSWISGRQVTGPLIAYGAPALENGVGEP